MLYSPRAGRLTPDNGRMCREIDNIRRSEKFIVGNRCQQCGFGRKPVGFGVGVGIRFPEPVCSDRDVFVCGHIYSPRAVRFV